MRSRRLKWSICPEYTSMTRWLESPIDSLPLWLCLFCPHQIPRPRTPGRLGPQGHRLPHDRVAELPLDAQPRQASLGLAQGAVPQAGVGAKVGPDAQPQGGDEPARALGHVRGGVHGDGEPGLAGGAVLDAVPPQQRGCLVGARDLEALRVRRVGVCYADVVEDARYEEDVGGRGGGGAGERGGAPELEGAAGVEEDAEAVVEDGRRQG